MEQSITRIQQDLQKELSSARYMHTMGVAETAEKLAVIHGVNKQSAYLAGLLHDCARELSPEKLLLEAHHFGIAVDCIQMAYPKLLHGVVGKMKAKNIYAIGDLDILEAIEVHTMGNPGMGNLAKIIYVADTIEPGRSFPYIHVLREKAEINLDKAVYLTAQSSIIYLMRGHRVIHPLTLKTRNYYAKREKDCM